jgi:hypothetical protein
VPVVDTTGTWKINIELIDVLLGIQWNHKFQRGVGLHFNVGWEEFFIVQQNQFLRETGEIILLTNADVSAQGWNLGAGIDL